MHYTATSVKNIENHVPNLKSRQHTGLELSGIGRKEWGSFILLCYYYSVYEILWYGFRLWCLPKISLFRFWYILAWKLSISGVSKDISLVQITDCQIMGFSIWCTVASSYGLMHKFNKHGIFFRSWCGKDLSSSPWTLPALSRAVLWC